VYLFGFSRGAYTVRLLAALLLDIGVIDFRRDDLPKNLNLVENKMLLCGKMVKKWGKYQKDVFTKGKNVPLVKHQFITVPSIEVLGLWDCVGSAGNTGEGRIGPQDVWAWGSKWKFAEKLRDGVENAFHALALTERRRFFKPVPCKSTMVDFFPARLSTQNPFSDTTNTSTPQIISANFQVLTSRDDPKEWKAVLVRWTSLCGRRKPKAP